MEYSDAYDMANQPETESGLMINPAVMAAVASQASSVPSSIVPDVVQKRGVRVKLVSYYSHIVPYTIVQSYCYTSIQRFYNTFIPSCIRTVILLHSYCHTTVQLLSYYCTVTVILLHSYCHTTVQLLSYYCTVTVILLYSYTYTDILPCSRY